jgi:hypothetical protein
MEVVSWGIFPGRHSFIPGNTYPEVLADISFKRVKLNMEHQMVQKFKTRPEVGTPER